MVIVGFLILAGAVNTSLVGSNGVLNRLAEDGVLTPWFQHPHKRFGTTNRIINTVGILQLLVIVASLGDVNTLGEAYAFGVIWSFVFMTMSMAVLRFKDRSPRHYKVPLNFLFKLKSGAAIRIPGRDHGGFLDSAQHGADESGDEENRDDLGDWVYGGFPERCF